MKLYFGEIMDKNLIADVDEGTAKAFISRGRYFENELEVEEDQVVIRDSIGRYVPLDFEAVFDLANALLMIADPLEQVLDAQDMLARLVNNVVFTPK